MASKKLTKTQERQLYESIKEAYKSGLPILEISLHFKISENYTNKVVLDLLSKREADVIEPSYTLVTAGVPVSKILNLESSHEYIRVEKRDDGVFIKPFKMEFENEKNTEPPCNSELPS